MLEPSLEPVISSKYNAEQKHAILTILDWLNSKFSTNKNSITLSGAAGTGKTTIIKEILNYYKRPTCITATTHKAVRIISQSVGKDSQTIQSLCGLRPNFNIESFDINNMQFAVKGKPKIGEYNTIIIDECSQLNTGMVELINIQSKQFGTKVIFIGDMYQLPPINEEVSSIFKNKHTLTLNTIVRQEEGNPLLELLQISRNDVDSYNFDVLKRLRTIPKNINNKDQGYIVVSLTDYTAGIIPYFKSKKFQNDVDFIRALSHTNRNVLDWNKYIRNNIFKSNKILEVNDFLTAYNTIVNEFYEPIIINSEDYVVKEMVDYIMSDSNVKGYLCKLQALHSGRLTKYLFVVDTTCEQSMTNLIAKLKEYRNNAINANNNDRNSLWKKYYEFKDRHLLLENIYDNVGKTIVSKDLDYGFAMTIYKSQGSTFNNVFVNIRDIINYTTNMKNDKQTVKLRNQLLYVALSRASNKAILLI